MLGGMATRRTGAASIAAIFRKLRVLLAHPSVRIVLDDWCGAGFSAALDVVMALYAIVLASDDYPFEKDRTGGPAEDDIAMAAQASPLGGRKVTIEDFQRFVRVEMVKRGLE